MNGQSKESPHNVPTQLTMTIWSWRSGNFCHWQMQLAKNTQNMNHIPNSSSHADDGEPSGARVIRMLDMNQVSAASVEQIPSSLLGSLSAADVSELNRDQRWVYKIIVRQLSLINTRKKPSPLHMIICGKEDTRKSKVLQTVTEAFQQQNCDHHLLKAAYAGVAAFLINGKTTHVIGTLSVAGHNQLEGDWVSATKQGLNWKRYGPQYGFWPWMKCQCWWRMFLQTCLKMLLLESNVQMITLSVGSTSSFWATFISFFLWPIQYAIHSFTQTIQRWTPHFPWLEERSIKSLQQLSYWRSKKESLTQSGTTFSNIYVLVLLRTITLTCCKHWL